MTSLLMPRSVAQCPKWGLSWCVARKMTQTVQGGLRSKNKKIKVKQSPSASWEERLSDVCTPLWRMEYEEQLKYKLEALQYVLRDLAHHVTEHGGHIPDYNGLFCPLQEVLPSPVIYGYRNKSSFSVNCGPNGDPKTVGNYVGRERDRSIVCVKTDHLPNIPWKHKLVAQCYEDYIHQSSLPSCLHFRDGGHWSEIIVRTNRNGDTMAIVTFFPQDLTEDEVHSHILSLRDYFTHGPGAVCNLSSLYCQQKNPVTNQLSPPYLLHGVPYLMERVLGLDLRVSPTTFLQINTSGAEILYTALRNLTKNCSKSMLLDVCCGTGVIGLSLAGQFGQVVGLELMDDAVQDARWNMTSNGIENCQFLAGKAERLLPNFLADRNLTEHVVAVMNPPRAGLHHHVVRAVRNCESVQTLLFVTCKPEGDARRNLTELCCSPFSDKIVGKAFVPQEAVAVDLFPHTKHCELALLLTR